MKILIFNIVILFFNVALFSQNNNYKATYIIIYEPINFDSIYKANEKKIENPDHLSMIKNNFNRLESSSKELYKVSFSLEYNKNESFFYKEPLLSIDEKRMAFIYSFLSIREHKYFTTHDQVTQVLNAYGEDFLVELPKIEWKITNEKKKIGKFNCLKATATIERENSKGKFNQNIIAWFAPEIPFNFGPKEYSGLPGLIVEVKPGDNIGYKLLKIKAENYKKIEKPTEGKNITFKEFNDLGKKIFENRKN